MANEQKTPLSRTLPILAQRRALDEIYKRGTALPGHVVAVTNSIVTIAFDVDDVTLPQTVMPVFGPEYIRYPIQVGDKGVAFPAGIYIGNESGLGNANPSTFFGALGNLASLVWFPIANKGWSSTPDASKVVIYGPHGVQIQDTAGALKVVIDTVSNTIKLSIGSEEVLISSSGVTIGPNSTIDTRVFLNHTHSGVQTGAGVTGPVV